MESNCCKRFNLGKNIIYYIYMYTKAFLLYLIKAWERMKWSEVVQLCPTLATPGTVDHQAPLSMGFSRQEYWSGHIHFLKKESSSASKFSNSRSMQFSVKSQMLCSSLFQSYIKMTGKKKEYWSGLPFPSPGDLPDPEIEPRSPALRADTLPSEPPGKPWERITTKREMEKLENITKWNGNTEYEIEEVKLDK